MNTWILIIVLQAYAYGSTMTSYINNVPGFASKESCMSAAKDVVELNTFKGGSIQTVCVRSK